MFDDDYSDDVSMDMDAQVAWEEEAHYWHTIVALVELIEERGYNAVMADVADTLAQRSEETAPEPLLADIVPMPSMSFMSIRKESLA